jgi:hypothetical protein
MTSWSRSYFRQRKDVKTKTATLAVDFFVCDRPSAEQRGAANSSNFQPEKQHYGSLLPKAIRARINQDKGPKLVQNIPQTDSSIARQVAISVGNGGKADIARLDGLGRS